jgi:hypothetical protein
VSKKDGGQAFPSGIIEQQYTMDGDLRIMTHPIAGMSLRDWFAGKAMQGLAARACTQYNNIPSDAYKMAAAMIAEREKETTSTKESNG